jgi:hypothetical protein
MTDILLEIDKYTLFAPKTKEGLKFDYPELANSKEFESITSEDVLMIWFFACSASPLNKADMSEKQKIKKSIELSYTKTHLDSVKRNKYELLDFPDKIQVAIDKMKSYRLSPRLRAKLMAEKAMSNYEKIIEADIIEDSKGKDSEIDLSKQKAYVDASISITKFLPSLMLQIEGGFGVSRVDEIDFLESLGEEGSLMDEYHNTTS